MIKEKVELLFDPEKSSEEIKEVFADDLARLLWLGVKSSHIVDQHFEKHCLLYAKIIDKAKKKEPLTAQKLFWIISGMARYPGEGIIGTSEKAFAEELLPFVNGEKTITYTINVKK